MDRCTLELPESRPVPFVVGMGRSGTTLLRLILDSHSALAIPPETDFPETLTHAGEISADAALRAFRRHRDWRSFGIDAESLHAALRARPSASGGEALRCFYRTYAARFGKSRWGDKTPAHVTRIAGLSALLPEAHFIHLIRDGRAVAASMRSMPFAPSRKIGQLAATWARLIAEGRRQGATVRHYIEVRYEDLVREPEREIRRICAFIDLPFEPGMLAYHTRAADRLAELRTVWWRRGLPYSAGNRLRNHRHTLEPPLRTRIDEWKQCLSAAELREIEVHAGETMRALGYSGCDSAVAARPSRIA